jgi:hypothetical protein
VAEQVVIPIKSIRQERDEARQATRELLREMSDHEPEFAEAFRLRWCERYPWLLEENG